MTGLTEGGRNSSSADVSSTSTVATEDGVNNVTSTNDGTQEQGESIRAASDLVNQSTTGTTGTSAMDEDDLVRL